MIPLAGGTATFKRYNASTQSATPDIVLVDARVSLQDPKDDDTLAFAAIGGLDELQENMKARPLKVIFVGGPDENPVPVGWKLLKNDTMTYTSYDDPTSDNGDYRIVSKPVFKSGLPGMQFWRAMVAYVE